MNTLIKTKAKQPRHGDQRLTWYVSGYGVTVYEAEQYNSLAKEWYIVGDSSTDIRLITSMIAMHNRQNQQYAINVPVMKRPCHCDYSYHPEGC